MAAISLFSSSLFLRARRGTDTPLISSSSASPLPRRHEMACLSRSTRRKLAFKRTVRAVAGEETLAPEEDPPPAERAPSAVETVAVPVSPSDALTMFFKAQAPSLLSQIFIFLQFFPFYYRFFMLVISSTGAVKAEGTMDDTATLKVSKALEAIDGVGDLKVQSVEGIASVELTQQTTVQATGVASKLIEIIQGVGFRLQTLSLSFEDEEDANN